MAGPAKRENILPKAPARPIDVVLGPLRVIAEHRLSGALLLLAATATALFWANSRWADGYHALLQTKVTVGAGNFLLSKPLILWINDGLMGFFFFVVGLEVKREVIDGELSTMRKALLPALCAVGGMIVPALLYALVNRQGPGASGWGVPMATDIAFALGVLALLGDRVPASVKIFLTAIAVADDIGAIVVIAFFYTDHVAVGSLVAGGVLLASAILANLAGVRSSIFFFLLGTFVWLAFLKSGVHATLAAVLMALAIPARTRINAHDLVARVDTLLARLRGLDLSTTTRLLTSEQQHLLHALESTVEKSTAPLQRLEHALMPLVVFVVLPVFALANAGVAFSLQAAAFTDPVALGIVVGLVLGKPIGIAGTSFVAVRLGVASLPEGLRMVHVVGVGLLAGVGFTMALFIASLAFADGAALTAAKTGVLLASLLAGVAGFLLLRATLPPSSGDPGA